MHIYNLEVRQQSAQSLGNSQVQVPISNSQAQGSSYDHQANKWVVNLSSVPLTPAQESLLAKGPNFALASLNPPIAFPRGRPSIGHIVIPYVQGLGGSIKHIHTKYGIQTYFKGNSTLKQMLVRPKEKKSEVICSYQCGAIDCREEYIRETSRALGECYKEHLREPSPIQVHSQLTGHQLSPDNFNILGREGQDLTRLIKESIYIRVNNPTHNRNIGKFHLNHIWDKVLFSTPNLKVALP